MPLPLGASNSFSALGAASPPRLSADSYEDAATTPGGRRRRRARTVAPGDGGTPPGRAASDCAASEGDVGDGVQRSADSASTLARSPRSATADAVLARRAARAPLLPTIDSPAPPALLDEVLAGAVSPARAATAPTPVSPARAAAPAPPPPSPRLLSGFAAYLHGELHPSPSLPTADVAWGQTERQRVHNALAAVPAALERFMALGSAVCLDSFLAVFTLLPLRVARAAAGAVARAVGGGRRRAAAPAGPSPASALFDVLCALIFVVATAALCAVPAGSLYFWMKVGRGRTPARAPTRRARPPRSPAPFLLSPSQDMTQEFLKLHVIYTAVEIFDRIGCSFAVDALDALSGTCALAAAAPPGRARAARLPALAGDAALAAALVVGHGLVLMCHGVAFSVAMHSKRGHTLIALTVAANFVEIKSSVFKRYDSRKLYTLLCADVVERAHLALALLFVLVEASADGSAAGWRPEPLLLARCGHVFAAEVVIDVVKHAVLAKFNELRPGVYREFTADLASATATGQSHSLHRALLFDPLAPAALAARTGLVAVGARAARGAVGGAGARAAARGALARGAVLWTLALAVKVLFGYALRSAAARAAASAGARPGWRAKRE